jgi:hypothetical protein
MVFVTNFLFIFYLDKQHPDWRNYRCWPSYVPLDSSPFFNVQVYTHVSVGVFTRTSFFLSRLVDSTFQRMEHLWMDA